MAYTLQEMKSQYPSSFAGLSDADAIYKIAELTGEDPKLLAEEYGVIAAGQGDFSRGISSSIDSMQAGLYGLTSWAAGSSPKAGGVLEKVRDWGMEGYQANMGEVNLRSKRTDNVENNETAGDWIDSAQYWLGYAIPQIAEAVIGSKGAGFLTKKTLESQVEKAIVKKYGKNINPNAKKAIMNSKAVRAQLDAIPAAVRKGEYAGIGTQAIGTELGHTYGGAVDEAIAQGGTIDDVDYGRATKYGLAAGATEFASDVVTLGLARLAPKGSGISNLLSKDGKFTSKSRTVNAAVRGTTGAGLEGTTELLQTGLEEMGAGKTFEEADFSDPTSFFAGAIGGGAMGTAGGASVKKEDPQDILDRAAETVAGEAEEIIETNQAEVDELADFEAEVEQIEELRDIHSQTFPSEKSWMEEQKEEQELLQSAQLLDPNSELAAQFKAWRKENQIYLSNDDKANQKIIQKFLKDISGSQQKQEVRNAHVAALDAHAALQNAKETRTEEEQDIITSDIALLLERRRIAMETGNAIELSTIQTEAESKGQLYLAEWNETKRDLVTSDDAVAAAAAAATTDTTTPIVTEDEVIETPVAETPVVETTPADTTTPIVTGDEVVETTAEAAAAAAAAIDAEKIDQDKTATGSGVAAPRGEELAESLNPFEAKKYRKVKGKKVISRRWSEWDKASTEFGNDFETTYPFLRASIYKGSGFERNMEKAEIRRQDIETVEGIVGKEMRVFGQIAYAGDWQRPVMELLMDASSRGNLEDYLYYQTGKWKFAMTDIAKDLGYAEPTEAQIQNVVDALNAFREKQKVAGELAQEKGLERETVGGMLSRTLEKLNEGNKIQDDSTDIEKQVAANEIAGMTILNRASDTKNKSKDEFTKAKKQGGNINPTASVLSGKQKKAEEIETSSPEKKIKDRVKTLTKLVPILKRSATAAEKKAPNSAEAKRKRAKATRFDGELKGIKETQEKEAFDKKVDEVKKRVNSAKSRQKRAITNLNKAKKQKKSKNVINQLEQIVLGRKKSYAEALEEQTKLLSPEVREQLAIQRKKDLDSKRQGLLPEGQPTPEFLKQQEIKNKAQIERAKEILANKEARDDVAGEWDAIKSKDIKSFERLSKSDQYEWTATLAEAMVEQDLSNLDTLQNSIERRIRDEKANRKSETKVEKVVKGPSTVDPGETSTEDSTETSGTEDTGQIPKTITRKAVEAYAKEIFGPKWRQTHRIILTLLGNKNKAKGKAAAMNYIQNNTPVSETVKKSEEGRETTEEFLDRQSSEPRATRKSIENMFKNLLGQKIYNRVATRINVIDTVAEAEKMFGGKNLRNTSAMVTSSTGIGTDVDSTQMDSVSNYREKGKAVKNDEMFFILENMPKGRELSVFMHEIGSHIGLDNILSPSEQTALVAKIRSWSSESMDSSQYIEQEAATRAVAQVKALRASNRLSKDDAVNPNSQIVTRDSTNEAQETIAYFITEVINLSQDPSTPFLTSTKITLPKNTGMFKQGSFLGNLLNKFRSAFRELIGYQKGETDNLTAQNILDLAIGSARIELETGGYVRYAREEKLGALGVGVTSRFGQFRSTMAFMENQRDQVSPEEVKDFYEVNIKRPNQNALLSQRMGGEGPVGGSLAQTSTRAPLNKANEKLKLSVNEYWQERIDAYVARKIPKNNKNKYITPNGKFLPPAEYSAWQQSQGRKEKTMRAGLKNIVEQRQRDAQNQADSINNSETIKSTENLELGAPQKEEAKKEIEPFRDWLRNNTNATVVQIYDNMTYLFKAGANSTKFVHQIINEVAAKMPAAKKWYDNVLLAEKTRSRIKLIIENVKVKASELTKSQLVRLNKFIEKSTVEQKWGYNPYEKTDERHSKVVIDPEMKIAFNKLSQKEKEVATEIFAHGIAMLERKKAIATVMFGEGNVDRFFNTGGLTGPYAPLKRYGNFIAEFKSQALINAEKIYNETDSPANLKALQKLKGQAKDYRISFYSTNAAARKIVDEIGSKYAYARASKKSENIVESRSPEHKVLQRVLAGLGAIDLDPASVEYKAVEQMVNQLYFDSLDEDNARRSQAKRQGFAGYSEDMVQAFVRNGTSEANLIASMEHGKSIYQALALTRVQAKGDEKLEKVYSMMVAHHTADLSNKQTPIQDRMAAVNTVYMLTSSIGYHVTNATQVMMVTIPKLVGDFGTGNYGKAMKLYFKGLLIASDVVEFNMKTLKFQTKIDISKAPKKYQALLEELQLRQLLDVGVEQDIAEMNRSETGFAIIDKGSEAAGKFAHRLYQIARMVEAYNRVSTATAAFELAQSQPAVTKRLGLSATEYAIGVVEDTQGNFSSIDAPLLLKKLPKVTGQYRKYQFMMAWVYSNAASKAFAGTSPQEKAAGRRTLGMLLGHAGLFSGAVGIPFSNMIASLFMGIGEGDEPEDLERWIEENVGDSTLAKIISRGLPSVFGVDMSTKLSQQGIFDPFPYTDYEISEDAIKQGFFEAIAGPSGATISNAIRSHSYAKEGNAWRAIEYGLPKGVRSIMESYRLGTEGYSLRNGDVVSSPGDFSGWQLVVNALGVPATSINDIKWRRGQQYELVKWFGEEQSRLRKAYVKAKKENNRDDLRILIDDWKQLQSSKDRVRPFFNNERSALKKTPVSSLRKASKKQLEREAKYLEQLRRD